jgi:membrane fusion protein
VIGSPSTASEPGRPGPGHPARYRGLLEKDYIAGEQVQLREADLIDQRSRLQALERDRLNVQRELTLLRRRTPAPALEQSRELSELRRSISSTDQELTESELRRQVLMLAPRDGVATAVTAEVGQSVDGSRPVVSIVPPGAPAGPPVCAQQGGGLRARGRPGDAAPRCLPLPEIRPHLPGASPRWRGWRCPARSCRPSASGEAAGDGAAVPHHRRAGCPDHHRLRRARPLQVGMQLQADIMQERRKLYEWVLEPSSASPANCEPVSTRPPPCP